MIPQTIKDICKDSRYLLTDIPEVIEIIDLYVKTKNDYDLLIKENKNLKENFERVCLDNENYILNVKSISKMYAELKKENEKLNESYNKQLKGIK